MYMCVCVWYVYLCVCVCVRARACARVSSFLNVYPKILPEELLFTSGQ